MVFGGKKSVVLLFLSNLAIFLTCVLEKNFFGTIKSFMSTI